LSAVGDSTPGGTGRVGLINVANELTVARLLLVPVFVAFLFMGGAAGRVIAFVLFLLASLTDLLDGRLARSRGLVTDFGKIADPIADKALIGSALVSLSILGELAWWVTAVILFRELGITALRFRVIRHGIIPASRGGKLKTLLQVIAISLYVLPGPLQAARITLMGAAVAATLITGGDYVLRAARLSRASGVRGSAAGEPGGAPGASGEQA
jgi:CDP-diacylglycerol---glycerol-3-phosphate 3-phosphatidyltransferase